MTFQPQSGYSEKINSLFIHHGVITAILRTTSSLNTDTSVFASGAHPFLMKLLIHLVVQPTKQFILELHLIPHLSSEKVRSGTVITSVTSVSMKIHLTTLW